MPNPIDSRRTKPRLNIVLNEDEKATAERLAKERRLSVSQLIGQLIRDEAARERRRK